MEFLDWTHCYDFHKLNDLIIPDACAHPARFPWGLINRIIDFCLEKGYIKPGEVCADPFAGVGLGGIACAYKGIRWVGCELEERFANWARLNFAKHAAMWDKFGLPHPIIVNGDSRNFASIVAQALTAIVSSPPYEGIDVNDQSRLPDEYKGSHPNEERNYGTSDGQVAMLPPGQVDSVLTSPPFTDENNQPRIGQGTREQLAIDGKLPRALNQVSEGNIASEPPGDVSCVISSPVYADESTVHLGVSGSAAGKIRKEEGTCGTDDHGYGKADGQVSELPEGEVQAVLASPPFQGSQGTTDAEFMATQRIDGYPRSAEGIKHLTGEMAETEGNLAAMKKEGDIDLALASPPYGASLEHPGGGRLEDGFGVGRSTPGKSCGPHSNLAQSSYGTSKGQVSGMEEGEVSAVMASPPFSNISPEKSSEGIDLTKQYETYRSQGGGMSFASFSTQQKKHSEGYGKTEGQVADMKEGAIVDVVLSSPSYPKDALGHAGGEGPRTTDAPHTKPGTANSQSYGESDGNVGNLEEGEIGKVGCVLTSPPFIDTGTGIVNTTGRNCQVTAERTEYRGPCHENTEGQLMAMPEGELSLVTSSPPYATITTGAGGLNTKPGADGQQSGRSPEAHSQQSGGVYSEDEHNLANAPKDGELTAVLGSPSYAPDTVHGRASEKDAEFFAGRKIGEHGSADYGEGKDQIANAPEGEIDAAVGSPPFAGTEQGNLEEDRKGIANSTPKARMKADYIHGNTPGQISRLPEMSEEVKNTYWGACRLVYEQVWHALKSGGEPVQDGEGIEFCGCRMDVSLLLYPREIKNVLYLVCQKCGKPVHGTGKSMPGVVALVLKDFIRGGERIHLCDNTARLLEAIGFEMLYRIRSWLVEKTDHGMGFLGPMSTVKKRSSFFRRIHEDGIRDANWWKTLTSDVQAVYLGKAAEKAKLDHTAAVAKWEGTDKKKPRPKEPTESKVRKLAAALAYDELCNVPDEELNDDRILEFEEILIARKRA